MACTVLGYCSGYDLALGSAATLAEECMSDIRFFVSSLRSEDKASI